MTSTQRQRPPRQAPPSADPASRGLILVGVAIVLGVILLVKGGGIGFDRDASDVKIDSGGSPTETLPEEEDVTSTSEMPPQTSVPPAELKVVALNAAGVNGFAGQAQQFLSVAGGYTNVTAITAQNQLQQTIVHFAEGYEVDATMVAQVLGLGADRVQPLPAGTQLARTASEFPADAAVAVLLGPDVATTIEGANTPAPESPEGESGT